MAYAETNYINQRLLTSEAVQAQARAQEVMISLQDFHTQLAQLGALLTPETIERTGTVIVALRSLLEGLLAALPAEGSAQANLAPELSAVRTITMSLLDELSGLEQALQEGNVAAQIERLNGTLDKIGDLRVTISVLVDTPAEDIIAPIKQSYTNLRGSPYSLVVFYAPAVLALLVQQLAITLASLGVVRERQMGAFEMFRVSPLGLSQILFGKALAYTLFATIAGIVLRALMTLLTVPFPAYPLQYLALLVMLSVASVGDRDAHLGRLAHRRAGHPAHDAGPAAVGVLHRLLPADERLRPAGQDHRHAHTHDARHEGLPGAVVVRHGPR